MVETISLRKGAATRALTLDGCVTRVKAGAGKVQRTSWLNGVMARAKRDQMVADLVAKGWATEIAKAATKKAPKTKRRSLTTKDIAVVGSKARKPHAPSEKRKWPPG